jgi:ribonuclease HI
MSKKTVTIYTDGACSGNPGPGGWGATLLYGTPPDAVTRDLKGAEAETTNNRMELTAAAEALEALREPCHVRLHSDSAYLINAFKQRWMDGWKRRGWKNAMMAQDARHEVEWVKVKGHAGVPLNEHVDGLAVSAMRTLMAEAGL